MKPWQQEAWLRQRQCELAEQYEREPALALTPHEEELLKQGMRNARRRAGAEFLQRKYDETRLGLQSPSQEDGGPGSQHMQTVTELHSGVRDRRLPMLSELHQRRRAAA